MAAKNAMVRAAFELQSSHVFEKHSKAWVTLEESFRLC